jgi:hypothetical protein
MPEPGISVDRAVNHYLESIDISPAAAAEFYEDLPIPDKPPLEDCHIHFSGLAQHIGQHRTGYGIRVHDPVDAKRHDPQAPESDILIFVGSFIKSDKLADMDTTLKHELTHYAQGETRERDQITDREAAIVVQLGFMRGRLSKILFAGKAALNSVLVDVLGNYTGARVSIA